MFFSKKCLGIDIGTSSIKIVEISSFGKKKKLENYAKFSFERKDLPLKASQGEGLIFLEDEISEVLKFLLKQGGFKEKKAAFSIPDFSTFFTTFNLPLMSKSEVPQAVEFEARHHIPLPLSEVIFDWQIIEKEEVFPGVKLKILLVAVPNKVLFNYQRVASLAEIELKGMEAEVFGLIRSVIPEEKSHQLICLVDIGWLSTTVSIVEKKTLKVSHSFDISSQTLTQKLSEKLGVDFEKAEEIKKDFGLDPKKEEVFQALVPQINSLGTEIERVCQDFYSKEGKKVENLLLAGETANLFGLKEYLASRIKKEVVIANPFSNFSFPPLLENRLKQLGPSFAVASGVALMGLES